VQSGLTGAIYRISNLIMRIVFVNLLWIAFSLIGFVILGFFPATIAMFYVCRKWVMGEHDLPVYKTFFHTYKSEFGKGNILGLCLSAILYILLMDYRTLQTAGDGNLHMIAYMFFLLLVFYGVFLLFLFPMYVHYELKVRHLVKNTFLIVIASPLTAIVMMTGGLLIYYISLSVSGIPLFFSGSTLAFFSMQVSYRAFQKIDGKRKKPELQNLTG
jgi:uncharacterized membrane protein YesL